MYRLCTDYAQLMSLFQTTATVQWYISYFWSRISHLNEYFIVSSCFCDSLNTFNGWIWVSIIFFVNSDCHGIVMFVPVRLIRSTHYDIIILELKTGCARSGKWLNQNINVTIRKSEVWFQSNGNGLTQNS